MKITEEMIDAGARAVASEHGSTVFDYEHEPYEFTDAERAQYRAEAEAVLMAVEPHIDAQKRRAVDAARRSAFDRGRGRR